jgi:beta-N-acetylhexosaminidase
MLRRGSHVTLDLMRRSRILFVCLLMLGGCATPDSAAGPGTHAAPTSKAGTGAATIAPSTVDLAYARMTPQQRVGQLFMFGVTSTGPPKEMYDELAEHTTGNVFLRGPSDLGAEATVKITNRMKTVATVAGVGPFISADQEGGSAQSLQGKGFSEIPTGVTQGEQQPRDLRADARSWSRELLAAGVNLDLAPIADVVPAEIGVSNEPIGLFRRQYGSTPETASAGVQAFVRGMQKGAVATSLKHFPGLGRATGNTDSDPAATDPTVRGDALLEPFAAGVRVGSAFVMVSSAKYPGIDPDRRACFSSVVMRDMLRGDLGFHGVVISDSFGSASLSSVPAGRRAIRFLEAGGTMVLDTNYLDAGPMSTAVLGRMERDPAFADLVEANVRLVLLAKERFGLID